MGTDIHACVQVGTPQGWESVGQGPVREGRGNWPVLLDRNYDLFSILAGVRNGRGFAGIEMASPVCPIAEPRGLPEPLGTLPPSRYEEGEPMSLGDHSFSWVTLEELERFPWDEPRVFFGVIPAGAYEAWVKKGDRTTPPESYCGAISGPGIVMLEEPEFLQRVKDGTLPQARDLHVRVSWTERHADACAPFYECVLPWLRELRAKNHLAPDQVRLVFGFDS